MVDFLGSILRRPPVGWWDVLDIAIVSFLIYEFLLLIRGTRAVQMGVGTLLIVGLFYVSRLAPLQTVNWLIRNLAPYVVGALSWTRAAPWKTSICVPAGSAVVTNSWTRRSSASAPLPTRFLASPRVLAGR